MNEKSIIIGSDFFITTNVNKVVDKNEDADIEKYFGDELNIDEYFAFINSPSIFGNDKIAYVRNIDKIKDLMGFLKSVETCIETTLIFSTTLSLTELEKKSKGIQKYIKALEYKLIIEPTVKAMSVTASHEVVDIFKIKGIEINNMTAMQILETTSGNLTAINNEAEKFSIYLNANPNEKLSDVLSNLSGKKTESIYALIDAFAEKKMDNVIKIFKNIPLNENSNDYRIYYGLAKRMSNIYFAYISNKLIEEYQDFVKQKVAGNKRFWTKNEAIKMMDKFALHDLNIKTGKIKFYEALVDIFASVNTK